MSANQKSDSDQASSTGRRKRGTLTREEILDVALKMMDAKGYDALSMPKLGRALNVGTMTLYGYIKNKEDLVDALIEQALEPVYNSSVKGKDWWLDLADHFRLIRKSALAHPAIGRIIATRGITSPSFTSILTEHLNNLRTAGFKKEVTVRGYYTALNYTLGFIAWEIPRTGEQPASEYESEWDQAIAEQSKKKSAALGKLQKKLVTVANEEQFEYGLRLILDALETKLSQTAK